jgi:hypothetical protein
MAALGLRHEHPVAETQAIAVIQGSEFLQCKIDYSLLFRWSKSCVLMLGRPPLPVHTFKIRVVSSAEGTFNRRLIVISDLHLGGSKSVMMSHPGRLVRFLRALPHRVRADEKLELVIAGDFIDFLTIDPLASWTPEPDVARKKLNDTMSGELFGPVFDALREAGTVRLCPDNYVGES